MKKPHKLALSLLASVAIAGPAAAQDWSFRAGDLPLSPPDLQLEIIGQTLVFYDNGQSAFAEDGSYAYTYNQGGTALGQYELKPDATVCIAYQNGFDRCDVYVRNGARLVLLTQKGERFPIRPK